MSARLVASLALGLFGCGGSRASGTTSDGFYIRDEPQAAANTEAPAAVSRPTPNALEGYAETESTEAESTAADTEARLPGDEPQDPAPEELVQTEDQEEQQDDKEKKRRVFPSVKGASGDTVVLKSQETNYLLENAIVQASARGSVFLFQGGGPYVGVTLRDVLIHVEPKTLWLDRAYWAVRGYDVVDMTFERVEITGFGRVTEKHDEGHAIYLNVLGALTLSDCDIHHNGGQGLQLVNRPYESVRPTGPAKGRITIRDTRFRENGFNPDRGATQVSIFGTGQSILMENVEISAGFDDTEFIQGKTGGALLIEAEGYNPGRPEKPVWWRPHELPDEFEQPFSQGVTELLNCTLRHNNPNRPLVQVKGCEELIVRGCTFEGGKIELDHPQKAGRNCGRIVWEGNSGDAPVFHKGEYVGPANEDFEIES